MKIPSQVYNYRTKVEGNSDPKSTMLHHLSSNESLITNVGNISHRSFHEQLKFVQDSLYKPKLTVSALGIKDFTVIQAPLREEHYEEPRLETLAYAFENPALNSSMSYNKDFHISTSALLMLYQNQHRLKSKFLDLLTRYYMQIYKENN